jgi:branched-chain amino acid transport system ATP-binding protein
LGLRIEASRLLAGVVALLVTLGLHLLLTRTSLGSKMLAVAEDSTAAQLMGTPGQGNRARKPARGHRQPRRDRSLSGQARRQGRRRPHADRVDGWARDMTAPLLRIEHLEVRYGDLIGASDVSLEVPEGSVVALLGSNGGGKTTILNAVVGLIPRHAGSIVFGGEEIGGKTGFSIVRKGLALSPEGWRLFVLQSVDDAGARQGTRRGIARSRLRDLSKTGGRNHRACTMSGGERQMLAVGRALMSDPKLLMLDEPSLGLAPAVVESMYDTFGRLHREGLTILLAEQSIELALEVSDFATVLQVGKSVLSGPAAALAEDPQVQKAYLGTG